jgi:hypothetical protein
MRDSSVGSWVRLAEFRTSRVIETETVQKLGLKNRLQRQGGQFNDVISSGRGAAVAQRSRSLPHIPCLGLLDQAVAASRVNVEEIQPF